MIEFFELRPKHKWEIGIGHFDVVTNSVTLYVSDIWRLAQNAVNSQDIPNCAYIFGILLAWVELHELFHFGASLDGRMHRMGYTKEREKLEGGTHEMNEALFESELKMKDNDSMAHRYASVFMDAILGA